MSSSVWDWLFVLDRGKAGVLDYIGGVCEIGAWGMLLTFGYRKMFSFHGARQKMDGNLLTLWCANFLSHNSIDTNLTTLLS